MGFLPENDGLGITVNDVKGLVSKRPFGVVSVTEYGAVGDGVTDDSTAIQAALDAVNTAGGGEVYLPDKVYIIGTTLEIGSNTTLRGSGTLKYTKATLSAIMNKNFMSGAGNENIAIYDITIDLNGTGNNGISFGGVTGGTIHNVKVISPIGYGIWLVRVGDSASAEGTPTKFVTVSDCHITGVIDVGIEYSGAISCTTVGCTVTGTEGIAGYYAWNGATDCVFSGNVAEGEGTAPAFKGYAVQPSSDYNPAPTPTQTQRISFVGNTARNVRYGFNLSGITGNEATDILVEGNIFNGRGSNDVGISISQGKRITVLGNQITGFYYPLSLSRVSAGSAFDSAVYINFDNNTIYGGYENLLYGNIGGSLSGNKFVGLANHAVRLYAWRNCVINNNIFVNLGTSGNAACIGVYAHLTTESTGNTFIGNKAMDDRATKYTNNLITLVNAADYNFILGNSAYGAKASAKGYINAGTGINNVAEHNIDAPA